MTTDSRHADAARAPGTDTWALRRTCRAAVGDLACGTKPAEPLRQRVCHGLIRNIVEVGFGSGVNVPFYPSAVTAVAAVEPSDSAQEIGGQTAAGNACPSARSA